MTQVTITVLAVVGATCECCSDAAIVSVRWDHDAGVRYYCAEHLGSLALPRIVRVARDEVRWAR